MESQEALAFDSGVSLPTIRNIESPTKGHIPNRSTLRLLANSLKVSLSEIEAAARGEGLSLMGRREPADTAGSYRRAVPPNLAHPTLATIPRINVSSAGPGIESTDMGYAEGGADRYLLLAPHQAADPDTFAVEVRGDSCAPWLAEGDTIVANPNANPVNGGLYVVQFKGDVNEENTIKLVTWESNERVWLRAPNPKYGPGKEYPATSIGTMSLVLYLVRPMDMVFRHML